METLRLAHRHTTSAPRGELRWTGPAATRLAAPSRRPQDLATLRGTRPVELHCPLPVLRHAFADPEVRAAFAAPPRAVVRVRVDDLTFELDEPDGAALWRLLVARLSAAPPP